MRALLRAAVVLAAVLLVGGCATSSDDTWIHPDTGSVPARGGPGGG